MKYIIIFLFSYLALFGGRFRHVSNEWNTYSICLEEDIGRLSTIGGWHISPWIGFYFQTSDFWIYHCEKGWLYPESDGSEGVWFFWEMSNSWIWTHSNVYPWAYDSFDGRWFDFCIKSPAISL